MKLLFKNVQLDVEKIWVCYGSLGLWWVIGPEKGEAVFIPQETEGPSQPKGQPLSRSNLQLLEANAWLPGEAGQVEGDRWLSGWVPGELVSARGSRTCC